MPGEGSRCRTDKRATDGRSDRRWSRKDVSKRSPDTVGASRSRVRGRARGRGPGSTLAPRATAAPPDRGNRAGQPGRADGSYAGGPTATARPHPGIGNEVCQAASESSCSLWRNEMSLADRYAMRAAIARVRTADRLSPPGELVAKQAREACRAIGSRSVVYALVDPRSDEVRYIGGTGDGDRRL